MTTTYWAPNQAAVAQVRSYAFTVPNGVGNTYSAAINGKTVIYASVSGDTAATVATALFNLLNQSTGIAAELTEVQFANPSSAVMTAIARVPGTPFAGVTVNGVVGQGLVLSTGNGLVNGITTTETTASASPSDVFDAQNWLRVVGTAPGVRSLPQNNDDVVVSGTAVPMLWNLDRLAAVQFASYTRWQSFTGTVGLPEVNPAGYTEWRATYFKFVGPAGSVPAGGLQVVLGYGSGSGSGPSRERYDVGSQRVSLTCLAAGGAADAYGIRFLGVHTQNAVVALGGVSLGVATGPGEVAQLSSCTVDGGATVVFGAGVAWTSGAVLTAFGGSVTLNSAPPTVNGNNGTQFTFATSGLTWPMITVQGGCVLNWLAGGIITALTMSNQCTLDKSADARGLTITDHTIDGDSCVIVDLLNSITFTNAGTVKQQVTSGPYQFTGTRTVKVT